MSQFRHKQEPKVRAKSPWIKLLSGFAYCLLLTASLCAGTFFGWIQRSPYLKAAVSQTLLQKSADEVFSRDSINILLLGCDEDLAYGGYKRRKDPVERSKARADMILVAKVDFKNKTITGVSIPRDTECELPGYANQKINAYHAIAKEGEEDALMKQAVEHVLPGVYIDRVADIDYQAFQKLVDMVGGVRVDIDKRMKYTDRAGGLYINFKPGKDQHLDGYQAMCYVRYRHGDSDFKRQERQKQFLLALKNSVLAKPASIGDIANMAVATLGGGLSAEEVAALTLFAKGVPEKNIRMGQVPVLEGRGTNLVIDERQLVPTLQEFDLLPKPSTQA